MRLILISYQDQMGHRWRRGRALWVVRQQVEAQRRQLPKLEEQRRWWRYLYPSLVVAGESTLSICSFERQLSLLGY